MITEEKTKNTYTYPLEMSENVRMTYDESPAHVGPLMYSVDFICKEGTEIFAAQDGIVSDVKFDSDVGGKTKEMEPLGNFIEIKHEGGEISEYEHLKKDGVSVKIGDRVKKGDLIGYSGATGWLAHLGPHLHFMVGDYVGGKEEIFQTRKIIWETNNGK